VGEGWWWEDVGGERGADEDLRHAFATFLTSTVMAEVSRIFKRSCDAG